MRGNAVVRKWGWPSRRGAGLVLLGAIYLQSGLRAIGTPLTRDARSAFHAALATGVSMDVWAILWVVAGLIGVVTGFRRDNADFIGFYSLAAWTALWASMCFCSTIFYGEWTGWIAGMTYTAFGGFVLINAGLYGRTDPRVLPPPLPSFRPQHRAEPGDLGEQRGEQYGDQ
jgi:hypothetical protein